jgi:hypothetical protein
MKPLLNCPYCGCSLKKFSRNKTWNEKYCPDQCVMKYHQYYFEGDFTSTKLSYIRFDTARFYVYVHFDESLPSNLARFYSLAELLAEGRATPILNNLPASKIPTWELEEIDATNNYTRTEGWLKRVDEKLFTYTLFS